MFSRFTTIAVSSSGRCFLAMHSALQGRVDFFTWSAVARTVLRIATFFPIKKENKKIETKEEK